MPGRNDPQNTASSTETCQPRPPITPLILNTQNLDQTFGMGERDPSAVQHNVPSSSSPSNPENSRTSNRTFMNSFTFRPLTDINRGNTYNPHSSGMASHVTLVRRDAEQAGTAYRYGLCSICLGVLCNWLGFFEASLNPIRYVGLGCVIIGSILIFMAVCQSLSVRQSARRRMCQQATRDLEAPSTYTQQTKPPEYNSLAFPNILPPSYEEAMANVYYPSSVPTSSQNPIQPPTPVHASDSILASGDQQVINNTGAPSNALDEPSDIAVCNHPTSQIMNTPTLPRDPSSVQAVCH